MVVKAQPSGTRAGRYLAVICNKCNTELSDCFIAKKHIPEIQNLCGTCEDKFDCFTLSESQIEKELQTVHAQDIKPTRIDLKNGNGRVGIKSYTGKVYDKLESDEYCEYPERDDCNYSWMRKHYDGEDYFRCEHMKYDRNNRIWYCLYGKIKRGI